MKEELAKPKSDLRTLLASDKVKEQIALALPKHMTSDRMVRVAMTALNKTPKLLDCKPASVLTALMTCSACGIEPDGRNAHLIPYGDTCQLILDYKGLVTLAKRNGVKCIRAERVCENDVFSFSIVDGIPKLQHQIDFKKPRGNAYCYFATCMTDGELDVEVMTRDEVDAIRKRSRASGSGPWVTDYDEMAKKTVLRRMSKRWDITPELRDVLDADADSVERDVTPVPSKPKLFAAKDPVAPPVNGEQPSILEPVEVEESAPVVDPPADPVDRLNERLSAEGKSFAAVKAWLAGRKEDKKSYVDVSSLPDAVIENVLMNFEEVEA